MAKVISLADYRSRKACEQAVQVVHNQDMGEFKNGMSQLMKDAQALREEVERLYGVQYFGIIDTPVNFYTPSA